MAAAGVIAGGAWLLTRRHRRRSSSRRPTRRRPRRFRRSGRPIRTCGSMPAAERQEDAPAAGNAGNHPMGLVRQRPAAGAAHQFRRHRRARDDDAQPQPGRARHHHRADQEAAHRPSRPRTAHGHRTDLCRGCGARRRAQGDDQQDRAARLRDEFQRAGHVRPVPEGLSGRAGEIPLSRLGQEGHRVPARRADSAATLPRHDRRGTQGARPLQHRAAG